MSYKHLFPNTSMIIGVFFCLWLSSCESRKSTPVWQQQDLDELSAHTLPEPSKANPEVKAATSPSKTAAISYPPVRFLSYNIKNYLTMNRGYQVQSRGSKNTNQPKPTKEINALVSIITSAQPDIVGLCEIGTKQDLADLQEKLHQQGLHLPHSHFTRGADPVRSLAILSKFSIADTHKAKKLYYTINGTRLQMSRGILDVTIDLPHRQVRFLGAHLKSKRPSKTADQALMRRQESMLLRKHADMILSQHPEKPLILYGDLNDTRRSLPLSILRGRSESPLSLSSIELKDSSSQTWTHYWSYEDIYSRLDYVMVNHAASRHIDRKESAILNPTNWKTASDHRPLLVIIK